MSRDNDKQKADLLNALYSISQIGITIIVCVAAGIFIGRALDSRLGTSPWMMLIFIFIGVGAAFKSIVDYAKKEQAKDKLQDEQIDNRQNVYDRMDIYSGQNAYNRNDSYSKHDPYSQHDQYRRHDTDYQRDVYYQHQQEDQEEGQDR